MEEQKLSKEQNDNKIRRWEDFLNTTKRSKYYAIQRLDLLIIAISSFGILFCLNVTKFFIVEGYIPCFKFILTLSLFAYVLAIVLNFISQFTGYWANRHAEDKALQKLRELNGEDSFEQDAYDKAKTKETTYNELTDMLNIGSSITMFIGMFLSGLFYWINF